MPDTLTGPGHSGFSAETTAILNPELSDALEAVVAEEITVDDVPDDQGEGA